MRRPGRLVCGPAKLTHRRGVIGGCGVLAAQHQGECGTGALAASPCTRGWPSPTTRRGRARLAVEGWDPVMFLCTAWRRQGFGAAWCGQSCPRVRRDCKAAARRQGGGFRVARRP